MYGQDIEQQEDEDKLIERFASEESENEGVPLVCGEFDQDPSNRVLTIALDVFSSGAHRLSHNVDAIKNLPTDELPWLHHVCNHRAEKEPPPNQGARFSFIHYRNKLQNEQSLTIMGETRYDEIKRHYDPRIASLGIPNVNNVEEYLHYCEGKVVIMGSVHVEGSASPLVHTPSTDGESPSPGYNYMESSPHVYRPGDNQLAYVTTNGGRALSRHRNKGDRNHLYGWGQPYGKRARHNLIEGKYITLCNRVGLQHNSTTDLACCPLPLLVHTIYEVTWKSPSIHDADYELVFSNYAFV